MPFSASRTVDIMLLVCSLIYSNSSGIAVAVSNGYSCTTSGCACFTICSNLNGNFACPCNSCSTPIFTRCNTTSSMTVKHVNRFSGCVCFFCECQSSFVKRHFHSAVCVENIDAVHAVNNRDSQCLCSCELT